MIISFEYKENPHSLMRRCGYVFDRKKNDELAFSRSLGASRSGYPKFHVYLKVDESSRETVINLHLDQKKPSYKETSAHSAEYEGELVEREAERIKQILGL
ncbi:MAG: hypothetical protein ABH800_00630 [Candidatus Nealsonbacteria bacterium]